MVSLIGTFELSLLTKLTDLRLNFKVAEGHFHLETAELGSARKPLYRSHVSLY